MSLGILLTACSTENEASTTDLAEQNLELERQLELLKAEFECVQEPTQPFVWQEVSFDLPSCWSHQERLDANLVPTLYLAMEGHEDVSLEVTLLTDYIAPDDQGPAEIQIGEHYYYQFLAGMDQDVFVLEDEPYQLNLLTPAEDYVATDPLVLDILASVRLPKEY